MNDKLQYLTDYILLKHLRYIISFSLAIYFQKGCDALRITSLHDVVQARQDNQNYAHAHIILQPAAFLPI